MLLQENNWLYGVMEVVSYDLKLITFLSQHKRFYY